MSANRPSYENDSMFYDNVLKHKYKSPYTKKKQLVNSYKDNKMKHQDDFF